MVMGNLGDLSPGASVAIGILVGLLSTSIQSLGLTLQRKSHILEDEKGPHDVRRPPHRRRRWQLGMGMFIISNLVGSTIQITTLPLPVLSTLQASGLVFNSICATLILGEPFTRWSLGGTLLVSTGAILIAIFGAIPEPAHSLDQLLQLLGRRTFVIWMIMQALLVSIIIAVTTFLARIPSISSSPRIRLFRGLAYGCISGILSAHSLLVAKSAVELLVRTIIDRINQFNRWQSWVILLGLVFLALTQLYYLHRGLKLVSTSVLYPLVFCIYNIVAILDGLIYFKQTDRLSLLHALLIALGTIILLSGVLALSWRLSDEQTQPAVPQSALAPGLGYVEDTDNEESSDAYTADEEAAIGAAHQALLNGAPMTPNTKFDTVLSATKNVRKTVRITEADEIWGELEDDDAKLPVSRHSTASLVREEHDEPTEHTSLLRHNTFKRRRRRSTGFHGFIARPERSRRRSSQEAVGGFWKMGWWKQRKGPGKEPPGSPNSRGGRGDNGDPGSSGTI
ncbi:magnesium transporter NIPA-domain-containing protein [Bisporella sp. PMI_857]|nr:magnesium transporter NIPA-domain-containing protein [Bisporella sp. PMI_857]